MKILYHHRIASKDGQYVHVEEIIKALKNLGHHVVVVGPGVSEQAKFGSDGGWVSALRQRLPKFCSELLEFTYAFYVFFKLLFAIIKHQPDVIYERYNLFLPAGIWIKKLFRLPFILEINSPLYDERKQYGGIALKQLAKWSEYYTWRNADHLCPVTHVLAQHLQQAGVEQEKVSIIANGIDSDVFNTSHKTSCIASSDKLTLGFVGFCREWHQLDKVLTLIAHHSDMDLQLLIVGDGPARPALMAKAKALNIENKLCITGIVERQVMSAWLDQIDIALQPAVTPWSSPLKLIEYLGKGKAIIAPDTKNIRELLTDNHNALLYDSHSPSSLLSCIERIIKNGSLKAKLEKNAAKTIEQKQLTWKNNAIRICALFGSLTVKQEIARKEIKE